MAAKRAMLFVDAQNLVMAAKNYEEGGFDYDVNKLRRELAGGYDLIRGYWFDSHEPDKREEKQDFYTYLQTNGFRVESAVLSGERGERFKEKEADIRLTTEMIAHAFTDSYDVAVLVTGDRDFLRAVRFVQDQGKIVHVASFKQPLASKLRRVADGYTYLDDIAEEIRLK